MAVPADVWFSYLVGVLVQFMPHDEARAVALRAYGAVSAKLGIAKTLFMADLQAMSPSLEADLARLVEARRRSHAWTELEALGVRR